GSITASVKCYPVFTNCLQRAISRKGEPMAIILAPQRTSPLRCASIVHGCCTIIRRCFCHSSGRIPSYNNIDNKNTLFPRPTTSELQGFFASATIFRIIAMCQRQNFSELDLPLLYNTAEERSRSEHDSCIMQ